MGDIPETKHLSTKNPSVSCKLRNSLATKLQDLEISSSASASASDVDESWSCFHNAIHEISREVLGHQNQKY
jgi:hypothetical protein